MKFETASSTLRGDRGLNQDRCAALSDGDTALLLLSDGMGGHPRGEAAAQIMVDTGRAAFDGTPKPIADPNGFLDELLRVAHERITDFGDRQDPPIDPRATGVAALVQDGVAYWSHVGDSRLYLFRDYETVSRTRDHSFVEQLRRRGMLDRVGKSGKRLRNLVTQCLGGRGASFSTSRGRPIELRPRDLLLLCSDGLWGQLAEERLIAQLRHHGSLERMARDLVSSAAQAGAPSSDNVTLVTLRWLGDEDRERISAAGGVTAAASPVQLQPEAVEEDEVQRAIDHLRSAIEEFGSD